MAGKTPCIFQGCSREGGEGGEAGKAPTGIEGEFEYTVLRQGDAGLFYLF